MKFTDYYRLSKFKKVFKPESHRFEPDPRY